MTDITEHGRQVVAQTAQRHGISERAVLVLLHALQKGHGTAAQFDDPEFGGMGQWSQGGMTQIGDMFNDTLTQKVNAACIALARHLADRNLFAESSEPQDFTPDGTEWWPTELGTPSATGSQNGSEYALFLAKHRLAVKHGGRVRFYDSGDHEITGFAQHQSNGTARLRFDSQHGSVGTDQLREVGAS